MAHKETILGALRDSGGPLSGQELGEKVGLKFRQMQTQVGRWVDMGLIEKTEDSKFALTEKGQAELVRDIEDGLMGDSADDGDEPSQESMGRTDFQRFIQIGKQVGIAPPQLITLTANHVWNGGDYRDMKWVAQGMQQMAIRTDLASRWVNAWRTWLRTPEDGNVITFSSKPSDPAVVDGKASKSGERASYTHSLVDGIPQYMGEGNGDMTKDDAMELAKVIAGARARATQPAQAAPQSPGNMVEDFVKMFAAIKEFMGENKHNGKSYMIRPGEDGYEVEEVEDTGKPVVVDRGPGPQPSPSYLVDDQGEITEMQPGRPVVIKPKGPAPAAGEPMKYMIDRATGEMKQLVPGEPIVIIRESPAASTTQLMPIQVKDADGNPMTLDLNTYIRLDEHKSKIRRDEEAHDVKMEVAKGFKDLLGKAARALEHMGED
ncbi:MAG: hypothetical protein ABIF09_05590 [Gemmatimonadota bacterium]